jgi:hypothetical protein
MSYGMYPSSKPAPNCREPFFTCSPLMCGLRSIGVFNKQDMSNRFLTAKGWPIVSSKRLLAYGAPGKYDVAKLSCLLLVVKNQQATIINKSAYWR